MLDRFILLTSRPKPTKSFKSPISNIDFIENGSRKLLVIFPQWNSDGRLAKNYAKRMSKKGYDLLIVHMDSSILEADILKVIDSYKTVQNQVTTKLNEITKQQSYHEIKLIAISLGSVPTNLVADSFKSFTSATFVVSGASLADGLWFGARTKHLRRQFEEQSVSLEELQEKWDTLAPSYKPEKYSNKNVAFFISNNDLFVPTQLQELFVQRLSEAEAKTSVKRRRLGHAANIIWFYLFSN